jgi:hypothetical protein
MPSKVSWTFAFPLRITQPGAKYAYEQKDENKGYANGNFSIHIVEHTSPLSV